jgi:HD domain
VTSRRGIRDLVALLPQTRAALAYAERQHAGQRRSADGAPFIEHPLEVATLLYYAGASDHVIAAGVLHDTIEKTCANAADLRARFGPAVATLVLAVSEDPRITLYPARKAALREQVATAGHDALMVFAADKISKVRELRLEPAASTQPQSTPGPSPSRQRKLTQYKRCLELLEDLLTDSPLVKQLRLELESIAGSPHQDPPALMTAGVSDVNETARRTTGGGPPGGDGQARTSSCVSWSSFGSSGVCSSMSTWQAAVEACRRT